MEEISNQEALKKEYGIEDAKTNKELVQELRKEYPKVQDFLCKIFEKQEEHNISSNSKYSQTSDVVDFIAVKLKQIKNDFTSLSTKDMKEEGIDSDILDTWFKMVELRISQAAEVYNGEIDILDKDGRFVNGSDPKLANILINNK